MFLSIFDIEAGIKYVKMADLNIEYTQIYQNILPSHRCTAALWSFHNNGACQGGQEYIR